MRMGTLEVNKFFVINMCICFQVFFVANMVKGAIYLLCKLLGNIQKITKVWGIERGFYLSL